MNKNPKFSLVIPCYNEEGNIELLINKCYELFKNNNYEVIFVENGSTDNSFKIFKNNLKNKNNFSLLRVIQNKGIGHGIIEGLKVTKGDIIGWTHGDLQTDPSDVKKAFVLSKKIKGDFLIKGNRVSKNRSFLELFFTFGLGIFESILFLRNFWEINAQPNIFTRSF
ncbi:glycosyltransferase family 2 protein, partial [Alphaproteobacteria bacterium]|nr:glycosyltransferase family 2 protein [Alphaproteobacteria bacterium]